MFKGEHLPIGLAESEGLPGGIVENAVVSQKVDHPGGQGLETGEPLPVQAKFLKFSTNH